LILCDFEMIPTYLHINRHFLGVNQAKQRVDEIQGLNMWLGF